jgi:septal ring factor EnvC (AmiA/AmiB activator)
MSKDTISVKSNGLRNELKEIRKSIDKLTDAIIQQTHKRYENNNNITCCNDDELCKCKKTKNS